MIQHGELAPDVEMEPEPELDSDDVIEECDRGEEQGVGLTQTQARPHTGQKS
eukprot:SAG11_NODE_1398_length_5024_cov_5.738680_3_plen_52_part_00